jgi:hypothetical protein
MSKILRVSESDYRIKVKNTGTITLDTGVEQGTVVITGDLLVKGNTTTVDTANLNIEDNTILLNKGELGLGVTEGTSGIQIDRGSLDDARFVWNETTDKFTFQTITDAEIPVATLAGITVGSIATDPTTNLEFDMQSGSGTLRITNSTGYESRVLDPDDIPNRQYISDYVYAFGGSAVVNLVQFPVTATYGNQDTLMEALSSNIRFYVRSGGSLTQRAQITANGLDVNNINILDNTILNSSVSNNLILTATNTHVEIDGILNLDDNTAPIATGGTSRIYSRSATAASDFELYNSGLFVANSRTQDELVVKNRALLLSMLF